MTRKDVNGSVSAPRPQSDAPEKALTQFAMHLALLEKTATGLGTMAFVWATTVLLGGFAIILDSTDFRFIPVILMMEVIRIFSRSFELEWQHLATWSDPNSSSHHYTTHTERTSDEDKQFPTELCLVRLGGLSKFWYWLQLLSATACVSLSLCKLIKQNFGHIDKGDTSKMNSEEALFIFYSLVLAEASLFITEKVYWEWTTSFRKLLEKVNKEYELGPEGMISTRRFFYDAYSKSVNGRIFDSLRMDMVSFAGELLISNSPNEQLIGARLLRRLSANVNFSPVTLTKIGVNACVIGRLVEMLTWSNPNEQELRESAAEILEQVASQKQNSLRISKIPGAIESVASLLHTTRTSYTSSGDGIYQRGNMSDQESIHVHMYNRLGLSILNELSCDDHNCWKIGNTRGLVPKIINFMFTTKDMFYYNNPHITNVIQSLELVKTLVRSTGITGSILRKEILEIAFTIGNITKILKNGERYPELQLLGIQVLIELGLEDDATERIGGTGGLLEELVRIFFMKTETHIQENLRNATGDAIAMLTRESKLNCHRVLELGAIDKFVHALKDQVLCISAARILRNLHRYTKDDRFNDMLRQVGEAAPTVLEAIIKPESDKQQEVMTGLALCVLKDMPHDKCSSLLQKEEHSAAALAAALVNILRVHPEPPIKAPRIQRFAIELAIWMMKEWKENVDEFRKLKIDEELAGVIKTTTDVEDFHLFSDTVVGISRHSISVHSLAAEALSLVAQSQTHSNA